MANGTATKKVGGAVSGTGTTKVDSDSKGKKRGSPARPVFDISTAVNSAGQSVYNAETKKLTGQPANFDYDKFKALGNADFSNGADFMEFRASIFNHKIASVDKKLAEWREKAADFASKAANLRRYKDDETRKKAMKADRMRKQLAALEAELDGVA